MDKGFMQAAGEMDVLTIVDQLLFLNTNEQLDGVSPQKWAWLGKRAFELGMINRSQTEPEPEQPSTDSAPSLPYSFWYCLDTCEGFQRKRFATFEEAAAEYLHQVKWMNALEMLITEDVPVVLKDGRHG